MSAPDAIVIGSGPNGLAAAIAIARCIRFWGKVRSDSLYVELVRTNRHFQLTERQFHWLSEYNR